MKNFTLTPIMDGRFFDVEIAYEDYGKQIKLKLSDYIFTDDTNRADPERRLSIYDDSLRGFAYFATLLTEVKDSLGIAEERYARWRASVRNKVQEYLKKTAGKSTVEDIEAGLLTLNAFLVPPCHCGNKASHFNIVSDDTEILDNEKIQPVCYDHKDNESRSLEYIVDVAKSPLVIGQDGGDITDLPLERLEYVITGNYEQKKTVCLGDINTAFQVRINRYRNLVNYKTSRGGLECIVKAFEMARQQQISPHTLLKKEYNMEASD